jgi:hypothetical protein
MLKSPRGNAYQNVVARGTHVAQCIAFSALIEALDLVLRKP